MRRKIVLILAVTVMFTMSACGNSLIECDAEKLYAIQVQVMDMAIEVHSTCSEDDFAEFSGTMSSEEFRIANSKLFKKCQEIAVEEYEIEFDVGCRIRTNGPFYGTESDGRGAISWRENGVIKSISLEISDHFGIFLRAIR